MDKEQLQELNRVLKLVDDARQKGLMFSLIFEKQGYHDCNWSFRDVRRVIEFGWKLKEIITVHRDKTEEHFAANDGNFLEE